MQVIQIRENISAHLLELRKWLDETADLPPEEMCAFFTARLDGYEEHMLFWERAYRRLAELFPVKGSRVLDLGCGSGLQLDFLLAKHPHLHITGVDLNPDMLERLHQRHLDAPIETVCADYFLYPMPAGRWDTVLSMESLHHFLPEKKRTLYRKIADALPSGGIFLNGDYIACCPEEEELLLQTYHHKRARHKIPEDVFVHLDIPLTTEHEFELLYAAGFSSVAVLDSLDGATILQAIK